MPHRVECTDCKKGFYFTKLVRLTDPMTGRDVKCCPFCESVNWKLAEDDND